LDRKTKQMLTVHAQHHPKAGIDRSYVPRKQGGRGQMHLEEAYAILVMKLMEYVDSKEDPLTQIISTHQDNKLNSWKPRERNTTRKKTNKGHRSKEDKINKERKKMHS